MQTVKSFTCLWVDNNFASLTSNMKDSAVPTCHGANVRFMRGRGALDPSHNVLGKSPLRTHIPPGDSADRVGRGSWDKASSSGRLKQRKDCMLWGELHLSFNPTALHISCVMSGRFLNPSELWFLNHKMGQIKLTL